MEAKKFQENTFRKCCCEDCVSIGTSNLNSQLGNTRNYYLITMWDKCREVKKMFLACFSLEKI